MTSIVYLCSNAVTLLTLTRLHDERDRAKKIYQFELRVELEKFQKLQKPQSRVFYFLSDELNK